MAVRRKTKAPSENLDYSFDWTSFLDGDTIADSQWVVQTGLTKGSEASTATATAVWLSGGTLGQVYRVTNTITTAGSRIGVRAVDIEIATK